MLSLIVSSVSAIFAVASAGFSIYTYHQNVVHDRKRDTLDAYNTLQQEVFDKLNRLPPACIREIANHPTSDDYKELCGYIARIEHFCVGVNMKIYDRETVYQLAHGYFDSKIITERIEPIIERKLQGTKFDYYENIHKTIDWMKQKSQSKQ